MKTSALFLVCSCSWGMLSGRKKPPVLIIRITRLLDAVGRVSGYGYSYRYFDDDNGIQITFSAYTSGSNDKDFSNYGYGTESKSGRKLRVSAGLNYLQVIKSTAQHRFYIHLGGAYYIARNTTLYQNYIQTEPAGDVYKRTTNKDRWCVGIGPGLETNPRKNVRMTLELPVTVDNEGNLIMYYPQLGIYYYFR